MELHTTKLIAAWRRGLAENGSLWFPDGFEALARGNPWSFVERAFLALLDGGEIRQDNTDPHVWIRVDMA